MELPISSPSILFFAPTLWGQAPTQPLGQLGRRNYKYQTGFVRLRPLTTRLSSYIRKIKKTRIGGTNIGTGVGGSMREGEGSPSPVGMNSGLCNEWHLDVAQPSVASRAYTLKPCYLALGSKWFLYLSDIILLWVNECLVIFTKLLFLTSSDGVWRCCRDQQNIFIAIQTMSFLQVVSPCNNPTPPQQPTLGITVCMHCLQEACRDLPFHVNGLPPETSVRCVKDTHNNKHVWLSSTSPPCHWLQGSRRRVSPDFGVWDTSRQL